MGEADWVRFRDPKIGTTAQQIAQRCGWQLRRRDGELSICALENFSKQRPNLLVLKPLFADGFEHSRAVAEVASWGHDDLYTRLVDPARIGAEVERLTGSGSREGGWAAHALLCQSTAPREMPMYLRDAHASLSRPELFPNLSMWALRDSDVGGYRAQVVRSLILAEHHPDEVERVKRGALAIEMASGLGANRLGLPRRERLGPLLACAAPWILGFASDRIGGSIVFMLGKLEFGRTSIGPSGDLIDQLHSDVFAALEHTARAQPSFDASDAVAALKWWTDGLNALMAVEHDPATHRREGFYDPVRHLAMTLTIDRLVAVVQQITISDRRSDLVRKMLFFDALDILEGLLRGHDFGHLTSPRHARAELQELEAVMPSGVRRVLLPRCQRAVDALESVQDGYWLPSTRSSDGTRLTGPSAQPLSTSAATTKALRLIRNGHHGYVSAKFHSDSDDRALLTVHDGRIPDGLPDLAFFHLVRMIAFSDLLDPQRLRARRAS